MNTERTGVSERQDKWTWDSVIEDWIADKTLSRRKLAWLEVQIDEWIDFMDRDLPEPYKPVETEKWMKNALNNPKCKTTIQCIAYLVDSLKPKRAGIKRLEKVTVFLKRKFPSYI
tara:strand:+ start:312 stop:656 length:345 start_codon:yes stop_codon:yes gene_type:complete